MSIQLMFSISKGEKQHGLNKFSFQILKILQRHNKYQECSSDSFLLFLVGVKQLIQYSKISKTNQLQATTMFLLQTAVHTNILNSLTPATSRQLSPASLIEAVLTGPTFSDTTTAHMGSTRLSQKKRVQGSWLGENNWVAGRQAIVKPGQIYPSSRQTDINQAVSKSSEARVALTGPTSMLTCFHTQNTPGDIWGLL